MAQPIETDLILLVVGILIFGTAAEEVRDIFQIANIRGSMFVRI